MLQTSEFKIQNRSTEWWWCLRKIFEMQIFITNNVFVATSIIIVWRIKIIFSCMGQVDVNIGNKNIYSYLLKGKYWLQWKVTTAEGYQLQYIIQVGQQRQLSITYLDKDNKDCGYWKLWGALLTRYKQPTYMNLLPQIT